HLYLTTLSFATFSFFTRIPAQCRALGDVLYRHLHRPAKEGENVSRAHHKVPRSCIRTRVPVARMGLGWVKDFLRCVIRLWLIHRQDDKSRSQPRTSTRMFGNNNMISGGQFIQAQNVIQNHNNSAQGKLMSLPRMNPRKLV
ncbi:hypothetical protein BDN70DRAFT_209434, partial [Pholiota conissans]